MENHKKARDDYLNGMKYKDIADKYGTTINTVKSWKKRYGWKREKDAEKDAHKSRKGRTQTEEYILVPGQGEDDGTRNTLQNDELTLKQQMFCVYYSRTFNAAQSYQKAYGCTYKTAMVNGSKMLKNTKVREELERLKEIKRQQIVADADDIVELQMRIAFSDIGDYLLFGNTSVFLNESVNVDTQLIQEIKQGKNGISLKLADRQKAFDWLSKHFMFHPEDKYKAEFERRRMEKETQIKEEYESDGFIEALKGQAADTFKDAKGIVEE